MRTFKLPEGSASHIFFPSAQLHIVELRDRSHMQRKTGDDAWLVLQPDGLALLKAWDAGYKWFNENEGEFGRRGGLAQTSEEIEAFRMGWLDAEEFEYQV